MKFGPIEISWRGAKAVGAFQTTLPAPLPTSVRVPPGADGWSRIFEPFAGAWQRGISEPDATADLLKYGAIYSCVSLIAGDVGKMLPRLQTLTPAGVWVDDVSDSPKARLMRRPNRYSTAQQFLECWVSSRLIHGETFALKERAADGSVMGLHLLNPGRVKILSTEDGDIYYELATDRIAQVAEPAIVPRSEILHDRANAFFHPLRGTSPLNAAALSGTFGRRIQQQSMTFFANGSRPSGQLTTDQELTDEVAERLKRDFEQNFGGNLIGRLLVGGSGLKYQPLAVPAADAQLIEQLKWTAEDCARCFQVPAYKVGAGPLPSFNNIAQLQQDYFTQALQGPIQAIELLLTEGLELPPKMRVELDTGALLRMDAAARAETAAKLVGAGILAPNEARRNENLGPVPGGDVPFMQQQMWQIGQLAGRSAPNDAAGTKELRRELDSLAAVLRGVQARLDRRAPD